MSVIKNLKSIFITDDASSKENAAREDKKPTQKPATKAAVKGSTSNFTAPVSNSPGSVNTKIVETLFQAIERSNIEGFDYIEFKHSVKGLEKMVADEATRFKSAFSTASTIGVTMDKLVDSANYYAKILDNEKQQFVQAASEQSNRLVDNRKRELDHLLRSLEEKKKMIEQMQQEIDEGEGKIKEIQEGIKNSTVKIENTKRDFETSWNFLKNQILADIDKMKSYLK